MKQSVKKLLTGAVLGLSLATAGIAQAADPLKDRIRLCRTCR